MVDRQHRGSAVNHREERRRRVFGGGAYDDRVSHGTQPRSSRDVILDAAQELVSIHGYDGMVISELTALSGLPASSIYYHFGSKLGVLAALLDRASADFRASFPSAAAFDEHPPLERFERWFTAACVSLDQRPEYLRLLLAVVAGSHLEADEVRSTVDKIRTQSHQAWMDVLVPVLGDRLAGDVAVLGRALTDGLSVRLTIEGASYASHAPTFIALVRSLASEHAAR